MCTAEPPQASSDATVVRKVELAIQINGLGVSSEIVAKVVSVASVEQLTLLDALVTQIVRTRGGDDGQTLESMSLDKYRALLERLGDEYVGPLTATGMYSTAQVRADQLREGVEVLAEMARMLRAIPPSRRAAMWPVIASEMRYALPHYQTLKHAVIESGVAAALDAEDHAVMTHLRREAVPSLDLDILRMSGESDLEGALLGLIRSARSAPRNNLATKTVAQLLEESSEYLQPQALTSEPAPKSKRWVGWGKIFTGMATAGANIAGGIALGAGGGPLAVGVTAGSVLASCAGGVGAIAEGVGALRGE